LESGPLSRAAITPVAWRRSRGVERDQAALCFYFCTIAANALRREHHRRLEDLDAEERALSWTRPQADDRGVRRYDGYVVQSTGDGIFALFSAPVGHEGHPQRAPYVALRM